MQYAARACDYADQVVAGEIPACSWVVLACKRFLSDLDRDDLYMSADGDRWCAFLESLPHVKGKWAAHGERLVLSPYQIFIVVNLYGWKWTATDLRRFREGFILVPRKNGKTFLLCGLGLGHLCIDDEYGAEIYCGAASEVQAWEVFRPARLICQRDDDLREQFAIDVNAKTLSTLSTGSRFQPVIGNPGDGASPSAAIADEFHEHKTSDQVDTFITGMGARDQPMMLYISTAGVDMGGPCFEKMQDVCAILKGSIVDDSVFGIIYSIDEGTDDEPGDRWDTIEAAEKANPNLGVSVNRDFIEGQLAQARRSPSKQNAYKTKHLNLWVGAKSAWLNMLAFQACRRKKIALEDWLGARCVIGIDLASTTDIASMAIVFRHETEEKYQAFFRHYLPEARLEDGSGVNAARYRAFQAGGWLTTTEGNVLDYQAIADDLHDIKNAHQIDAVAYDPFQATQFSVDRSGEGFPMIQIGQTVKNFSEPMKALEALIMQKHIEFELDPVLMWCAGNVVAKVDKKDNIYPNKSTAENKIDPIVALIMAMNRWLLVKPARSIYEDQDLRST